MATPPANFSSAPAPAPPSSLAAAAAAAASSSGAEVTFPLRPWPTNERHHPKNVAEFIARMNLERDGFRNVNEAQLRRQIAEASARREAKAADDADADDNVDSDEEDGSDDGSNSGNDEESRPMDVVEAKAHLLRHLDSARNTAMLTLDLVSLLQSKESPASAQTLSHTLRELVGIGTLGAGRISLPSDLAGGGGGGAAGNGFGDPPANPVHLGNPARARDDELVSTGWALKSIGSTCAAAARAAKFLSTEASREARYWEEVMCVRDAGWTLLPLPGVRRTLCVQFGFREAAPEFRAGGIATLRRDDDKGGAVALDLSSRISGVSERLVVTVSRDGRATGRSRLGPRPSEGAPLEQRVLEARNTILAQELWHELRLEARGLMVHGVRTGGGKITFRLGGEGGVTVAVELVTPPSKEEWAEGAGEAAPAPDADGPDDNLLAEYVRLGLHVLLSHAHGDSEMRRIKPCPPHQRLNNAAAASSPIRPSYHLMRPFFEYSMHRAYVTSLVAMVGDLIGALRKAGFADAFFGLQTQLPASLSDLAAVTAASSGGGGGGGGEGGGGNHTNTPHALVAQLLATRRLHLEIGFTSLARIAVRAFTNRQPLSTVAFVVVLPTTAGAAEPNPLLRCCPPSRDVYSTQESLFAYLRLAAQRIVTDHLLRRVDQLHRPPVVPLAAAAPQNIKADIQLTPEGLEVIRITRVPVPEPGRDGEAPFQEYPRDWKLIVARILGDHQISEESEKWGEAVGKNASAQGRDGAVGAKAVLSVVASQRGQDLVLQNTRWQWAVRGASSPETLDTALEAVAKW